MESRGSGILRIFLLVVCVAGIWAAYISRGSTRDCCLSYGQLVAMLVPHGGVIGVLVSQTPFGPAIGIEALWYISYPAQVLAKYSKMIPVDGRIQVA